MSTEFKIKELNIQKKIEEMIGCNIDVLKNNRYMIKEMYQSKFCAKKINANVDFVNIYYNVYGKEEKTLETLTEKCIKRANVIESLSFLFCEDGFMMDEINDANMFWNFMQYEILPLEVLWSMEMFEKNNILFCQKEQTIFKYLIKIAQLYLCETNKLVKKLIQENKKREKSIKKQGFQLKITPKCII